MKKLKALIMDKSIVTYHNDKGTKHIALIKGGMSIEREVSLISAKDTLASLLKLDYKVTEIDMGRDIATVLMEVKPDIVFNCLHGTNGEDGCLPGLLNILRIPYTHSGVLASALAFNKIKSKEIFKAKNILTIGHLLINKKDNIVTDPMPRPYVIKPVAQGSSLGVEIIFPEDNFNFADYDFPYGEEVLVEQYIKGREMQVAVFDGRALDVLEIKLLQDKRFYDYETKYTEGFAQHLLPAPVPSLIYSSLLKTAEAAIEAVGATGLCRVEFILEEGTDKIYILEINTHPGLTPLSICPEIAAFKGIDFDNLIEKLLDTASFEE